MSDLGLDPADVRDFGAECPDFGSDPVSLALSPSASGFASGFGSDAAPVAFSASVSGLPSDAAPVALSPSASGFDSVSDVSASEAGSDFFAESCGFSESCTVFADSDFADSDLADPDLADSNFAGSVFAGSVFTEPDFLACPEPSAGVF